MEKKTPYPFGCDNSFFHLLGKCKFWKGIIYKWAIRQSLPIIEQSKWDTVKKKCSLELLIPTHPLHGPFLQLGLCNHWSKPAHLTSPSGLCLFFLQSCCTSLVSTFLSHQSPLLKVPMKLAFYQVGVWCCIIWLQDFPLSLPESISLLLLFTYCLLMNFCLSHP